MDRLVDIDDSHAGFDGDLCGFFVEGYDPVHGAHVKEGLAIVERQVAVSSSGPSRADGHVVLPAVSKRLAALFQCRWAGDKGARSDGADQ